MQQKLFEQFLEHRNELFSFIRSMVRNTHEAEDLFQEIAVAVIKKGEEEEEILNFKAWIKQVARNQLKTIIRNQARRNNFSLPTPEMMKLLENSYMDDETSDYFQDQYDALLVCLTKLKFRVAEIIRRRFMEDESYEEIGQNLEMSEAAARKASLRARAKLADCVKAQMNSGAV